VHSRHERQLTDVAAGRRDHVIYLRARRIFLWRLEVCPRGTRRAVLELTAPVCAATPAAEHNSWRWTPVVTCCRWDRGVGGLCWRRCWFLVMLTSCRWTGWSRCCGGYPAGDGGDDGASCCRGVATGDRAAQYRAGTVGAGDLAGWLRTWAATRPTHSPDRGAHPPAPRPATAGRVLPSEPLDPGSRARRCRGRRPRGVADMNRPNCNLQTECCSSDVDGVEWRRWDQCGSQVGRGGRSAPRCGSPASPHPPRLQR
jgi:hypothetical protein